MTTDNTAVFVDQDVTPQILSVIDKASKQVIIVTPYLDLWRHVRMAIEQAVQRGIDTKFILRNDNGRIGGSDGAKGVAWLLEANVKVYALEGLHAKIYLNESSILVSSMNITESSTTNSMEIAVRLLDPKDQRKARDYVARLLKQAAAVAPLQGSTLKSQNHRPATRGKISAKAAEIERGIGHCIRCGRDLFFEPSKPLCDDCYEIWAEYENEDYPEQFCHSCGRPEEVSYAKPLCRTCYASLR